MRQLDFFCPKFGQLKIIGNRLNNGHDFVVKSNTSSRIIDYLIFLDSRGVSRQFKDSLSDKLITNFEQEKKSYLLVCRPIELTTWATFLGFMANNRFIVGSIITNMGFVDFTPKKLDLLEDALQQVKFILGDNVASSFFVENYFSSSGENIDLYSVNYSEEYRKAIESLVSNIPMLIINTPFVSREINLERSRPETFFDGLVNANAFNHSIYGAQVVDIPDFDEVFTYDAVHYTSYGNDAIYRKIKEFI